MYTTCSTELTFENSFLEENETPSEVLVLADADDFLPISSGWSARRAKAEASASVSGGPSPTYPRSGWYLVGKEGREA